MAERRPPSWPSPARSHDHRDRRTGGGGQGHARRPARRPLSAFPISTPASSTAPSPRRWSKRAGRSTTSPPPVAAARALDLGRLADRDLRGHEAGEAASRVAVHAAGPRARSSSFQRDFAAPAGGRRARRPRHRHGRLPRGRREDLRHRRRRRPAPGGGRPSFAPSAAAASPTTSILAEIMRRDARDAGRAVAPLQDRRRRALARYHRTWI